jgi:uncharacterized protein (DUF433 family)
MIDWRTMIEHRPELMDGRPFFKGTRLTVRFILERLADGWSAQELLDSYPRLNAEHIQAALAYAADNIEPEPSLAGDE